MCTIEIPVDEKYIDLEAVTAIATKAATQSISEQFDKRLQDRLGDKLFGALSPFLNTPDAHTMCAIMDHLDVDADEDDLPVEETTSEQSDEEVVQELLDIHNEEKSTVDEGMTPVPLNELTIYGQKKVFAKFDPDKFVTALIEENGKPRMNAPGLFTNEIKVALAKHDTFVRAYKEPTEDEDGVIQIANEGEDQFKTYEFMNTMMAERQRRWDEDREESNEEPDEEFEIDDLTQEILFGKKPDLEDALKHADDMKVVEPDVLKDTPNIKVWVYCNDGHGRVGYHHVWCNGIEEVRALATKLDRRASPSSIRSNGTDCHTVSLGIPMGSEPLKVHEVEDALTSIRSEDDAITEEKVWRGANVSKSLTVNAGMVAILKSAKGVLTKRVHKQRIDKHLTSAKTKSKRSRFDGQDVPWLKAYLETGLVPYTAALTAVFMSATGYDLKSVQKQLGITTV